MIKRAVLACVIAVMALPFPTSAEVKGDSFDVLGSVMETHRKEINASEIISSVMSIPIARPRATIASWKSAAISGKRSPSFITIRAS